MPIRLNDQIEVEFSNKGTQKLFAFPGPFTAGQTGLWYSAKSQRTLGRKSNRVWANQACCSPGADLAVQGDQSHLGRNHGVKIVFSSAPRGVEDFIVQRTAVMISPGRNDGEHLARLGHRQLVLAQPLGPLTPAFPTHDVVPPWAKAINWSSSSDKSAMSKLTWPRATIPVANPRRTEA